MAINVKIMAKAIMANSNNNVMKWRNKWKKPMAIILMYRIMTSNVYEEHSVL